MSNYESDLRQFIIQNFLFGKDDESLAASDSLLDRGIIDSTGVMELVSFLEEKYQITLQDEELTPENLDSIERMVRLISRKTTVTA